MCLLAVQRLHATGPATAAQTSDSAADAQSTTSAPDMPMAGGWAMAFDGAFFGTFDREVSRRPATEFRSQNWLMWMASHRAWRGVLTGTAMVTAEPLTVGAAGYAETFQEGEARHGIQITDHQHPHDLFMQLSASWRLPLGDRSSVVIGGGPVGEATLGPVAFMHRASSAENPVAPLSHHIFDSTHIVEGVVLARADHGPVSVEGSLFRGREPDEHHANLETGALDSWAGRIWLRPGRGWTVQASYGVLHEPEQLEPGNQRRANASASWLRQKGTDYSAVTIAVGQNQRTYSDVRALLIEGTRHAGSTSIFGRFEDTSVETEILLFPEVLHRPHPGELVDPIQALTAGAVRNIARVGRAVIGIGGDLTVYGVPPLLRIVYGDRPMSFHLFVRVAPETSSGRMWDTTMGSHDAGGHHHH